MVRQSEVTAFIQNIDANLDGKIELSEFMNAVAGWKELRQTDAFSEVVLDLRRKQEQENRQRNRISVERSGGGT